VARNALFGLILIAGLAVAGCSGADEEAQAADMQAAALQARSDSMRQAQQRPSPEAQPSDSAQATLAATATVAGADSVRPATAGSDTVVQTEADAALADSIRKAREIEVMRETFAYGGGTRDPFASLINVASSGPEIGDLDLVGVYQDLRHSSNSVVVLREKVSLKRHKLRTGDQVGRARLVQIRPRDAVFMVQDFGFERQETLSLRKQEVETP
jgi:hypothetical protein